MGLTGVFVHPYKWSYGPLLIADFSGPPSTVVSQIFSATNSAYGTFFFDACLRSLKKIEVTCR